MPLSPTPAKDQAPPLSSALGSGAAAGGDVHLGVYDTNKVGALGLLHIDAMASASKTKDKPEHKEGAESGTHDFGHDDEQLFDKEDAPAIKALPSLMFQVMRKVNKAVDFGYDADDDKRKVYAQSAKGDTDFKFEHKDAAREPAKDGEHAEVSSSLQSIDDFKLLSKAKSCAQNAKYSGKLKHVHNDDDKHSSKFDLKECDMNYPRSAGIFDDDDSHPTRKAGGKRPSEGARLRQVEDATKAERAGWRRQVRPQKTLDSPSPPFFTSR